MSRGEGLTPLEIASGYVFGRDASAEVLQALDRRASPRLEFESAVLGALMRPPCLVAFSGGRDSSAVLALAALVARREGLPLPIPFTYRFPEIPSAEESAWQTAVVEHLGLDQWVRKELRDELDAVGPLATTVLAHHGLYWPANGHSLVPVLEAARGGSVLSGAGGDQLLDPGRHARLAAVLARRARPRPRDLLRLTLAAAPTGVRAARRRCDALVSSIDCAWLRPQALEALRDIAARDAATEPVGRRAWVDWTWRSRALQAGIRIMQLLAADADSLLVHPFLSPRVVAAFGEAGRRDPPRTRTHAIDALVGDLLPAASRNRATKAVFSRAFWGPHSSALVGMLAPADVDSELIDGQRAVEVWAQAGTGDVPFGSSLTLLQSVWLSRRPGEAAHGVEQRIGAVG